MPLLKKSAIDKFLNRERDDWRWIKKLTDAELEELADRLSIKPPIWKKLKTHQRAMFLLGVWHKRFFFIADTGTGKSLLAIALARYFKKRDKVKRVLVLSQNKVTKREWCDEIEKHSPNSSYIRLIGPITDRWEAIRNSDSLFAFESYAGLLHLTCDVKEVKRKKKTKNEMVPNKKKILELASHFDGLIMDESLKASNHSALPWRICKQLAQRANICFPMTATPFNRDPEPLWAQMFLVDTGHSLGETLALFRAAFYRQKKGYWTAFEYHFDTSKRKLLNRFLADSSIEYEADAATLPGVTVLQKEVNLPGEAKDYFELAKQALVAARGNFHEVKNAFLRMRQISSGFIGYENDETGEKAKLVFPNNPKLDSLLSVCETIRPQYKVIIFYDFTYSGERIMAELKKMGLTAAHLYGKTKEKEVDQIKDRFNLGNDLQFLILQNQFGIGINIQVAKYGLYYESPVSAVMRYQTRRRVERQYSKHERVFIYDFIARGTMDHRILEFHKSGQNLLESLVRGRTKV